MPRRFSCFISLILFLLFVFTIQASFAQLGGITVPTGHSFGGGRNLKMDKAKKYIFSSGGNVVIMWEVATATQIYSFPTHGAKLYDYDISPDNKIIVIADQMKFIAYSTETGRFLWENNDLHYYNHLLFSRDGSKIFALFGTGYDVSVDILDPKTGRIVRNIIKGDKIQGHPLMQWYDENNILILNYGACYLLDATTEKIVLEKQASPTSAFQTFHPGRKQVFVTTKKGNQEVTSLQSIDKADSLFLFSREPWEKPRLIIPSLDDEKFVIWIQDPDDYSQTAYLYSGEKPVSKKLPYKYAGSTLVEDGLFSGRSAASYFCNFDGFQYLDLKTGKTSREFKRQIADLGIDMLNTMQYNYLTGELHMMTDDSLLKSIDLYRMKPYRHANTSAGVDMVAVSPSGDTIAVFTGSEAFMKSTKTNKVIVPVIPASKEASSTDRDLFFFNTTGSKLYYTTFSVPTQKSTLKCYDVHTKAVQVIAVANSFSEPFVHPDKTTLAYKDDGGDKFSIKVIDLRTGKQLMSFAPPKDDGGNFLFMSDDKKTIMMASHYTGFKYYSVPEGAPIQPLKHDSREFGMGNWSKMCTNLDLSLIVTGSENGHLWAQYPDGSYKYDKQLHQDGLRSILFSPNNELMYTVSFDQTIKVLRAENGDVIGTLYLFNDGNDYVFLGTDGRFDGTPGGMRRLYYVKNRQKIPLDLVYEKYYTPNLYQRLVNGEKFIPIPEIILSPSPKVKIVHDKQKRNLEVDEDVETVVMEGNTATISVEATASDDKVDELRVFQNGKVVSLQTRNLIVDDIKEDVLRKTFELQLQPGENIIRAIALNSQRTESEPAEMIFVRKSDGQEAPKPITNTTTSTGTAVVMQVDKGATMHLIVVGINAYKNPSMQLNYALADATAFKLEMEKEAATVISKVQTHFITDAAADAATIKSAFTDVAKTANPEDVLVFYYAGHGVMSGADGKEFYLVPNDVTDLKNVAAELSQKGIPAKLLQQYAIEIPAQKQLFILDACQSAGAFEELLSSDGEQQKKIALVARSTGTHWIAASGAKQFANEFSQLGHGAFTYVLLQALKGSAKANNMITVNGLKNFVQVQVPELLKKYSGTAQYPASYGSGADFPVMIAK